MGSAQPTVCVVVPVHNALPYLTELLDSILGQDIESDALSIVTVDDGSTDGSSEVLEAYGQRHPRLQVLRQDKSGRPGRPRNAGLRAVRSDYVFFADADDILAPSALRLLVGFAEEHGSDVVVPKMVPLGGRGFPTTVYQKTIVAADLVTAFRTLFPQKLYRRRLLTDHDIWFPEGVRLDDGIFNARVYVRATRISIFAEADCYFLREHRRDRHLSRTDREPASYTASVERICEIVSSHVSDRAVAADVLLDVFRRKCLIEYDPRRFGLHGRTVQEGWVTVHKALMERYISPDMDQRLESPDRERCHFIRLGDLDGLLAFGEFETAPRVTASVTKATWEGSDLRFTIGATIEGRLALPRQLIGQLHPREGDGVSAFPIVRVNTDPPPYGQTTVYTGAFPLASIRALSPGTYDLHLVSETVRERLTGRVRWQEGVVPPVERERLTVHGTRGGNATIRKGAR
jgi:glycosyltransferase involved in cell wall biosynthesis